MISNFVKNNEKKVQRLFEIMPGFISWNLIIFPYWGIFLIPKVVAYFMLTYNFYWFYQSFQIAISGIVSHIRIQAAMQYDWMRDVKNLKKLEKVQNFVIVCTYKEPLYILERTFKSLASQTLPKENLTVVLAMEKKEDKKERQEKAKALKKKFSKYFKSLYVTVHEIKEGEIAGKASNERYAAIWIKQNVIDKKKADINYSIVTSCDADHVYHKNHFAALTYKFLTNKERHSMFWQPAVLFYNNIWKIPAVTRVQNMLSSIWNLSQLPRRDRLISTSNYSLSFKLLDKAGYWDPDKIPEDWGIFFKSYFKTHGKVEAEGLYLPVYADSPESETLRKTLVNQYQQRKRWAWGVSDIPWMLTKYITTPNIPFWDKTSRMIYVLQGHFFAPVHWFAITIGLQIPTLLNPRFGRTALGFMVPKISSFVLTVALVFLGVMLFLDKIYKPDRPNQVPLWRVIIQPLEFFLMPIAGFFFSALPGIDAHTRLMMGKYIEYKVTEKV